MRPPLRALGVAGAFLLSSGLMIQLAAKALPADKRGRLVSKAGVANKRCATLGALRPPNRVPPGPMFTFLDLSPRLLLPTHHSATPGTYPLTATAVPAELTPIRRTQGRAR